MGSVTEEDTGGSSNKPLNGTAYYRRFVEAVGQETMIFPIIIVIIIAGFYLAFRVSLRGAFFTGLLVGAALAVLRSFAPADPEVGLLTIFASHILGAVPVYMLANRFDGILAFLIIVPVGFLLLLAGGPIECALMFVE